MRVRETEEMVEELSQAMKARGYDPASIRQVMGG
jgi:energy-coupling factor transporter transmembrane protein EcfT